MSWSFLVWIWTFPQQERPGLVRRLEEHAGQTRVIRLGNAQEIRDFLQAVRADR